MSWSKVSSEHKKPLRWWYHKVLCEFCWWVYKKTGVMQERYYYHGDKCQLLGFNIYGYKI